MQRLGCFALILIAACDGGTSNNNHDLSASVDMRMQMGQDGGGAVDGGGDSAISCGAEGAACSLSGLNGLCKSNVCSLCTDTTDDPTCASAYTSGFICVNGNCQTGCHDSSTCPFQICDPASHACRNCVQDFDCTDNTKPYCQTNGSCGANPVPCTSGTACNGGWCCAGVCQIGGMCCPGDGICTSGETCSSDNQCVNIGNCPSPRPANQVYVDSGAAMGMRGVGSKQCPITSLDKALKLVPNPSPGPFLVCTQGTFRATDSTFWPRNIPQNFELDGTFCSPSPAPGGATTHTKLNVPNGSSGVQFSQAGPASIHGFDIISGEPSPPTDRVDGILIEFTDTTNPVRISDVTVKGFQAGLDVAVNGYVLIGTDAHFNNNQVGLAVEGSGKVVIDTTASGYGVVRTTFDNNGGFGISVVEGSLTITGQSYTGPGADPNSQNVVADNNGVGLLCGLDCTLTAVHFSASSNNGTGAFAGHGLQLTSDAHVSFRHSTFSFNQNSGLFIYQPLSTSSSSLTALDFGKSADHGFNVIESNHSAGVCITFANTTALPAAGNKWKSAQTSTEVDCDPKPSMPPDVNISTDCTKGVDVAGPVEGKSNPGNLANVNNCGEVCTLACNLN